MSLCTGHVNTNESYGDKKQYEGFKIIHGDAQFSIKFLIWGKAIGIHLNGLELVAQEYIRLSDLKYKIVGALSTSLIDEVYLALILDLNCQLNSIPPVK